MQMSQNVHAGAKVTGGDIDTNSPPEPCEEMTEGMNGGSDQLGHSKLGPKAVAGVVVRVGQVMLQTGRMGFGLMTGAVSTATGAARIGWRLFESQAKVIADAVQKEYPHGPYCMCGCRGY